MVRNPSSSFVMGALLGVIAVFLGILALRESPSAYAQAVESQGGMVAAMACLQTGVYDTMLLVTGVGERKMMAVYKVNNKGSVGLMSTRELTYDLKVLEYNNDKSAPSVLQVKEMVEKAEKAAEERHKKETPALKPPGGDKQ